MNRKALFLILAVLLVAAKFGMGLLDDDGPSDERLPPPTGMTAPAPVEPPASGHVEPPGPPGGAAAADPATPTRGDPADDGLLHVVPDATVLDYGRVHHRGPVDLSATIVRIRAGESHPHRNDGSVFGNRERLLPRRERGYYREYVHPTDGIRGAGPQRIVVGRDGDWWYTPDHYASFIPLGRETRR